MSGFGALDIAGTGAGLARQWMEVLANNLANSNTIHPPDEEPFRAELVYARERSGTGASPLSRIRRMPGAGVSVVGFLDVEGAPQEIFEPSHPFADENGVVTRPVVDVVAQLTDLIMASRSYQMNLQMVRSSQEAYEAAMRIGRS